MKTFFARRFLWFCLIWLAPAIGSAQNLVPNPSFEEYSWCPAGLSQFDFVKDWRAPNYGTTDYYNACATGGMNVPNGLFGYQQAHSGSAYAGIVPFEPGTDWREYAQIKLIQPLQKGVVYHAEFFVSRVERIAIANIEAYFSVDPPSSSGIGLLDNLTRTPQVRNRSGLLTDTLNWMKIEGNFMAEGGEQYLTIGNFEDNAHTYTSSYYSAPYAYYYLDDVSVEIASCPIVTDLGPDEVLCPGGSKLLDATSNGASYHWQDGSTRPSYEVTSPGMYWVEVKLGTCSFRDSIRIDYLDQLPTDRLKDTILCNSQIFNLNASFPGAVAYYWQDGSVQSNLRVTMSGTYWVDIDFGGCIYRDSVKVEYRDQINILPDYTTVCPGTPVVLDATTEGATYTWQDGSTRSTFVATTPGYYYVAIQTKECVFYDYAQVYYYYPPQVFQYKEIAVCQGETTLLNASAVSGPYRWQDGSSESTLLIDRPGKYWVEFYSNGCLFRDSVLVETLKQLPGDRLRDTTLCTTQYITLDAYFPGAIGYRWQNGYSWSSIGIYTSGTYWVDIDFGGCTVRDSITILYLDQINKIPDYLSICPESPLVLDATMEGATYLWQDGSNQPTLTVTTPGYYSVAIEVDNCTFYDYTLVTTYSAPQLFYPKEINLCNGETTFLNASWVNGPYLWQDGSTKNSLLVTKSGTYRVKFYWYGCVAYDSVTVRYPEEALLPFPKEISLCQGQSMVLDASSLNSWYYQWSTGNSGAILQVSQPGTYSLVASWNNCSIQFSTTVSMFPNPVVTIKNDTTLCYGRSLVLQAVGDNQHFRWSDNSAGAFLTVQQPGAYWLEVEDKTTGCTSRKTIEISQTECWEELVIPNVITPHNGDALNQAFVIDRLTDHWSLEIVNRWGTSVYQTTSYRNDWQGNGQVGLYYYILRNTVSGQAYRGWLQVLQ